MQIGLGQDMHLARTEPATLLASITRKLNGKLRAKFECAADAPADDIKAQAETEVPNFLADKTIRKVIYVPGKLVNIVVS